MKPITLTLPLVEAKQAFAAVLPHVSTDDVTPVITCAQIEGKSILATDRYTVARHELSVESPEPFMLHRSAVAWVARVNLRNLANHLNPASYSLKIEMPRREPDDKIKRVLAQLTISSEMYGDEQMRKFDTVVGNFPPVGRLFNEWKPATVAYPVALKPEMVAKVNDWARTWHREQAVTFELGEAKTGAGESVASKHPPVKAKLHGLEALIQPNLILK